MHAYIRRRSASLQGCLPRSSSDRSRNWAPFRHADYLQHKGLHQICKTNKHSVITTRNKGPCNLIQNKGAYQTDQEDRSSHTISFLALLTYLADITSKVLSNGTRVPPQTIPKVLGHLGTTPRPHLRRQIRVRRLVHNQRRRSMNRWACETVGSFPGRGWWRRHRLLLHWSRG